MHIIRPLIKPYASIIDSLLDLARVLGDKAFISIKIPIDHVLSYWNGSPLSSQGQPTQNFEPEATESSEYEPIYSSSEAATVELVEVEPTAVAC